MHAKFFQVIINNSWSLYSYLFPIGCALVNSLRLYALNKLTLISISIFIKLFPSPVFKIILKFSLIIYLVWLMPLPKSLSKAFWKITLIVRTIFPNVFTFSMRLSTLIIPYVFIAISKSLVSRTIFQKILKLTFINTIFVLKNTLTMLAIHQPLSFVWISFWRSPNSMTIFSS